jgi:hypothetical protein
MVMSANCALGKKDLRDQTFRVKRLRRISLGLPKTGKLTIHASSVIMVDPFVTNELIN